MSGMGRAKLRALAFYPATENGRLAARPRRPHYRASMHGLIFLKNSCNLLIISFSAF